MQTLVLGLGNILYGDEGLGARLAQRLYERYVFPPDTDVADGGTLGMALLGLVEKTDQMVVLDAVDFGQRPGMLFRLENEAIPAWITSKKATLHQTSFAEVMAFAAFKDTVPARTTLIGMQPVDTSYGETLSLTAQAKLPELEEMCLETLKKYGVSPRFEPGRRSLCAPCLH